MLGTNRLSLWSFVFVKHLHGNHQKLFAFLLNVLYLYHFTLCLLFQRVQLPTLQQNCDSASYGCSFGYECDEVFGICRMPRLNEVCFPFDGNEFGCDTGHLCKDFLCSLPVSEENCDLSVGCIDGLVCDFFTKTCRRPIEEEGCYPENSGMHGCFDGLKCVNYNLLARADSNTGNILVKMFNLPTNTSTLPNFDDLLPSHTSYRSDLNLFFYPKDVGSVFEGNLVFPFNGSWTLNINSTMSYQLIANDFSVINSNGNLKSTKIPIYITEPNASQKVRLMCYSSNDNATLLFSWTQPGATSQAPIPSTSWMLDQYYTCRRPYLHDKCTDSFGCQNGTYCNSGLCIVSYFYFEMNILEFYYNHAIQCYSFFTITYLLKKPNVSQECLTQIGCTSGYICDVYQARCRKPDLNESCSEKFGCQEGLICNELSHCVKPSLNGSCVETVGCSSGYICRNTNGILRCQVCSIVPILLVKVILEKK
jgi:hypothetical protein